MQDRSSRPHRLHRPTAQAIVEQVERRRRQRYTPRTNGKAERFIQTALREWAYTKAYTHSDSRTAELPILAPSLQLAQASW